MERRDMLKIFLGVFAGMGLNRIIPSSAAVAYKGEKENINRLRNRKNPTELEQKHVPEIKVPSKVKKGEYFEVKIKVGFMKEHPSKANHWITMIKILVDGKEVAKEDHFIGGVSPSEASFIIKLVKSASIEAIEHCNLHGTWISDPVKVKVI